MSRRLSTALTVLLYVSTAAGQSDLPANDLVKTGIQRLERAEYAEALSDFEKGLDAYAAAQRLNDVRQVYMRMFTGNRTHANALMKAMVAWVERHRTDLAGLAHPTFSEFAAWVQERDALAHATINLVHNSPDWK
jgi:hypothetical protein